MIILLGKILSVGIFLEGLAIALAPSFFAKRLPSALRSPQILRVAGLGESLVAVLIYTYLRNITI